jgi:hypothetical protein
MTETATVDTRGVARVVEGEDRIYKAEQCHHMAIEVAEV